MIGRTVVIVLLLALLCGCRTRDLSVEIANSTPHHVDMIALIPRHTTGLLSNTPGFLMAPGVPRCFAASIEPAAVWSRARNRSDLIHENVLTGSSGHLIVMLRQRSPGDAPAQWQNYWITQHRLDPIRIALRETDIGTAVDAQTRDGLPLDVQPVTEEYLRNWNPSTYQRSPDRFSLLDILDARNEAWPLRIDPNN